MLSTGVNLLRDSDTLRKVTVDYLYHSLRNPKEEVKFRIHQLRVVRSLDEKQYKVLKRELPYIVCGMFNPPYRRTENFAYTEYFIVDIDHISEKGLNLAVVRDQVERDERVVLSFLSPSEDGLKVLFRLKERCYDAGIYSLFYKAFLLAFSKQYHLEQVIDERTCDVCRACFISIDPYAYYCSESIPVDMSTYLSVSDTTSMFDLKHELEQQVKKEKITVMSPDEKIKDPDQETINRIKQLLQPQLKQKLQNKKVPYVPECLDDIINDLKKYIEKTGLIVYEIMNIQYAKKIRCKMGVRLGEINLFYGKRGFSVVQSPRSGTSDELNRLLADLITSYLLTNEMI